MATELLPFAFVFLPRATPLSPPALLPPPQATVSDPPIPAVFFPAASTSITATDCIIKDAKILATTIFFFPVVFLAISDTTT